MNYVELYTNHRDTLDELDNKSGVYIIGHKKYKGWVKIGHAPSLKRRLGNYKTYTPDWNDLILYGVAVKKSSRVAKITDKKSKRRDYCKEAEARLLSLCGDRPKYGGSEWREIAHTAAVKYMQMLHEEGYESKTISYPADGSKLNLYIFKDKTVKKTNKRLAVSSTTVKNKKKDKKEEPEKRVTRSKSKAKKEEEKTIKIQEYEKLKRSERSRRLPKKLRE
jgi:uncharacterized protein YueI